MSTSCFEYCILYSCLQLCFWLLKMTILFLMNIKIQTLSPKTFWLYGSEFFNPLVTNVPNCFAEHWAIEARIKRRDGIFPHEWPSHEWGKIKFLMSHECLATCDKWVILPILSSYPFFNNIPDRTVQTCIEQFSQNNRKFFKTVGKK